MNKNPIDKETARLNAIAEVSALLRETSIKHLSKFYVDEAGFSPQYPSVIYGNSLFDKEEHNSVKRMFLRLCSEV